MNNDIKENFILYKTAKDIKEVVKEIYFDMEDTTTKTFEIEGILFKIELQIFIRVE